MTEQEEIGGAIIITANEVGKPTVGESFPWEPTQTAERENIPLLKKHLKPCPFCGSAPSARICGTYSGYEVFCGKCGIPEVREYWSDFCEEYARRTKQEDYDIPWNISLAGTMTRIIKRWNSRLATAPLSD